MAVRLSRERERRDERAATAVADRALELARGRTRIAEREMRDRHQPAAARPAEVDDPAVVSARVRLGELDVLELALPEDRQRRIENRRIEPLPIEKREPLRRIHR